MSVLRQVSVILYRLKRNYPSEVILRKIINNNSDLKTGEVSRSYRSVKIKRAAVLPEKRIPEFIYDLSYAAANRNFAYGGYFSSSTRLVIIDDKDIPKDFKINEGDEVLFDDKIHSLKVITDTADKRGYLLTVTSAGASNE
jgi:hypothetical protein